jgi:hypothetical protein
MVYEVLTVLLSSKIIHSGTLIYRTAWNEKQRGNAADADQRAMKSMKTRQKLRGQKHKDEWLGMAIVADAHSIR